MNVLYWLREKKIYTVNKSRENWPCDPSISLSTLSRSHSCTCGYYVTYIHRLTIDCEVVYWRIQYFLLELTSDIKWIIFYYLVVLVLTLLNCQTEQVIKINKLWNEITIRSIPPPHPLSLSPFLLWWAGNDFSCKCNNDLY